MLKLLISSDWIGVRDEILSRIATDVRQRKGGRILMVPELISHDTERRLAMTAGDTASRYAEVLSFTRLARRVSEGLGSGAMECLDNGGRMVAMAAAARQLHSRLKAYASVETKPEFLAQLVDAVDEFKRCCISPEDLAFAAGQTEGTLAQKLEELSLLLSAYDSLCSRGKRDPRDQMTWLLEQLEEGDYAREHVFYIDGFPDYTRQHMAILEHLIQTSPMVTVGLNCDRPGSQALAFEKAGDTAAEIIRCAEKAGVPVEMEVIPERQDPLGQMCKALFQGPVPKAVAGLETFRADSEYPEVQAAAERVMELVRKGSRYRDIGIVCSDMGAYQNLVDLVFHRCNIPMYRSGTEDILRSTVISTVLAALEAALEGFEQKPVMRYLRSVLSPLDGDTCDKLENYAVTWGVRGKRWQEPWDKHPDGMNGFWTEATDALLRELNEVRALTLEPLFHLSDSFRQGRNLREQVQALHRFLEEICLSGRLKNLAAELDAQGDHRGAQILNQLWEILLSALEQMEGILGDTVWEPDTFVRLLTLLLSQYDVGTIPPVLDAVTVGPVSAMRCHQTKHLLVLGASEGALPGYGGATGLLTDQERVALRQMGVPLTGGAMEGIQAEFAEIYGVFAGATETVTVSYPGNQPSYVFRRLTEMCSGEQHVRPTLGAAMTDGREAGAWLARWNAEEEAEELGVGHWYEDTRSRVGYALGSIRRENVTALYGKTLQLSASQIDKQAECRMSHFLNYGLRAKERKEAAVDPAEFGTYVHAVLEQTAADVMARGGFHHVSLEETMEIAAGHSEEYARERFSQIDSQRVSYLFRRNRRELEMVVQELWQELNNARFQPESLEFHFGEDGQMEAISIPGSIPAVLRGYVDRVDVWQEDGRSYFRVIDYKTGKKNFDYCDILSGVGLQMLLYLFALGRGGRQGTAAGVQYFPARVPLVTVEGRADPNEAVKERKKQWVRKGMLLKDEDVLEAMDPTEGMDRLSCKRSAKGELVGDLADRAQMKLLEEYVFLLLGRMVDDIASGNVQANPYTRGKNHDACAFCPYGNVCKAKNGPGRRNFRAVDSDEFWERVEKEVTRRG